jgi:hypothetical protein
MVRVRSRGGTLGHTSRTNENAHSAHSAAIQTGVRSAGKETVLYREGEEVVNSALPHTGTQDQPLQTYGSFGPILELLQVVLKLPDNIKCGGWENGPDGRRAVFRFRTKDTPTLDLVGCCYPNGNMNPRIGILADIHGELVIAP